MIKTCFYRIPNLKINFLVICSLFLGKLNWKILVISSTLRLMRSGLTPRNHFFVFYAFCNKKRVFYWFPNLKINFLFTSSLFFGKLKWKILATSSALRIIKYGSTSWSHFFMLLVIKIAFFTVFRTSPDATSCFCGSFFDFHIVGIFQQ